MWKRVTLIVFGLVVIIGLSAVVTLPRAIEISQTVSEPPTLQDLIAGNPILSSADLEAHCPIESIALERMLGGWYSAEYTVTYYRSGKAEYVGKAYVENIGLHHGQLPERSFARLCQLVAKMSFKHMEKDYFGGRWSDRSFAKVTVVEGGTSYEILDFDEVGPPDLWALEHALDSLASKTSWTKVENSPSVVD